MQLEWESFEKLENEREEKLHFRHSDWPLLAWGAERAATELPRPSSGMDAGCGPRGSFRA